MCFEGNASVLSDIGDPIDAGQRIAVDSRFFSDDGWLPFVLMSCWNKVHPNGRINYKGQETLADGSDPFSEAAVRAAELVDRAAAKAEVCGDAYCKG